MKNRIEKLDESIIGNDIPDHDDSADAPMPVTGKTNKTDEDEEPRERAGIILKREREKQGLSLEIVHETTKIPLDTLRAIEEDYTIHMLSPFYYSGFVKMYAHYLNIDASEVIDDYRKEELPEHIDLAVEEFEIPKWITQVFTKERKQQIIIIAGAFIALGLLFTVIKTLTTRKPQLPVQGDLKHVKPVKKEIKKAAVVQIKKVKNQTLKFIAPKTAPKVVSPPKLNPIVRPVVKSVIKPAAGVTPVAVATKNIILTVRANQNSWLRVKTDGVVVFQSTLRMGAVETWPANDEIEISGRNINQLEFELNGKMIGTLGRKDRNAKKVVITKNGLSVKK